MVSIMVSDKTLDLIISAVQLQQIGLEKLIAEEHACVAKYELTGSLLADHLARVAEFSVQRESYVSVFKDLMRQGYGV